MFKEGGVVAFRLSANFVLGDVLMPAPLGWGGRVLDADRGWLTVPRGAGQLTGGRSAEVSAGARRQTVAGRDRVNSRSDNGGENSWLVPLLCKLCYV